MTHSPAELVESDTALEAPGWAMAPANAAAAGFVARGSWLLEPDTGTGMLLYPRDWTFTERRDVTAHLRGAGWSVVPIARFLHLTSDGTTSIRLLSRVDRVEVVADLATEVRPIRRDAEDVGDLVTVDALEASV